MYNTVFLKMDTKCSKHVEGLKHWIKNINFKRCALSRSALHNCMNVTKPQFIVTFCVKTSVRGLINYRQNTTSQTVTWRTDVSPHTHTHTHARTHFAHARTHKQTRLIKNACYSRRCTLHFWVRIVEPNWCITYLHFGWLSAKTYNTYQLPHVYIATSCWWATSKAETCGGVVTE
jgi:hypothetical protein